MLILILFFGEWFAPLLEVDGRAPVLITTTLYYAAFGFRDFIVVAIMRRSKKL
ncbi:hypothetical protein [[Eubacterium] cellulosolvens]